MQIPSDRGSAAGVPDGRRQVADDHDWQELQHRWHRRDQLVEQRGGAAVLGE